MRKKPLYVVDFDDVLVNMSWKLAMLAYSNICTPMEICDTLIQSDKKWVFEKFNQPEDRIMDFYGKGFYDDLPPTRFCEKLNSISDKNDIFVVSYIMENCNADDKVKWLKKYLPKAKYQFIYCDSGIKKSDIINGMKLDYVAFADDRVSNLADVMENTDAKGKMFYVPMYGCNSVEKIREKLIDKEKLIYPCYISDLYVSNYSILKKVDWKHLTTK